MLQWLTRVRHGWSFWVKPLSLSLDAHHCTSTALLTVLAVWKQLFLHQINHDVMTHLESHRGSDGTWETGAPRGSTVMCEWERERGKMHSHVSQLRLSPHQDVPNPLDLEQFPLKVVHRDRGVGHGDDALSPWETHPKPKGPAFWVSTSLVSVFSSSLGMFLPFVFCFMAQD